MAHSVSIESLTDSINETLYYLDPMNTGSVENELHDEYYRLAESIAKSVQKGVHIEKAVQNELEFWFDESSPDKVLSICKALTQEGLTNG